MKVGDLVKNFLTEQVGIIIRTGIDKPETYQVMWTTQGLSLFGPGSKEWVCMDAVEVLHESR